MLGQFKWVYAVLSPSRGLLRIGSGAIHHLFEPVCLVRCDLVDGPSRYVQRVALDTLPDGDQRGILHPTRPALIADHTHLRRVRVPSGLHQMGIYLGVIAGGFAGFVSQNPALGWRSAFTACGVVGMAYTFAAGDVAQAYGVFAE